MAETAAELRARLGALAESEHNPAPWDCNWDPGVQSFVVTDANREQMMFDDLGDFAERVVALVNAWPAIDGMLARLAAAEADADQLYDMLDTHWDSGSHCNDWVEEDDEAMQLHRDALALRDQS